MSPDDRLPVDLASALAHVGVDPIRLQERSNELILCGSRAQKLNTSTSDWDLVAIGDGIPRRKRGNIDLVPIDRALLHSPRWLESELAWHLKTHGVWLKGQPGDWIRNVRVTPRTLSAKLDRIDYRLDRIRQAWPHLSSKARDRYVDFLRRDLQRYTILKKGQPIPSGPQLDAQFDVEMDRQKYIGGLIAELPDNLRQRVLETLQQVRRELAARPTGH